jgi:hypothetical protein
MDHSKLTKKQIEYIQNKIDKAEKLGLVLKQRKSY